MKRCRLEMRPSAPSSGRKKITCAFPWTESISGTSGPPRRISGTIFPSNGSRNISKAEIMLPCWKNSTARPISTPLRRKSRARDWKSTPRTGAPSKHPACSSGMRSVKSCGRTEHACRRSSRQKAPSDGWFSTMRPLRWISNWFRLSINRLIRAKAGISAPAPSSFWATNKDPSKKRGTPSPTTSAATGISFTMWRSAGNGPETGWPAPGA